MRKKDAGKNSDSEKRKLCHHLPHQKERLEAFFRECTHPNESQKAELARELNLKISQVANWFQNRRNTSKVRNDLVCNSHLREENTRMHYENASFSELLNNLICSTCNPSQSTGKEAKKDTLQKLKMENSHLKEQYEKSANELTKWTGKPIKDLLSMSPESLEHLLRKSSGNFRDLERVGPTPEIYLSNSQISAMDSRDKEVIVEEAVVAMNELITLLLDETLWFRSPTSGGFILHLEKYYHKFPKFGHLRTSHSRIETSRDLLTMPIAAPDLFEMFMYTNQWADLFPTIVMDAQNIETLNTASLGEAILHLMYARTHILSPLVAPREFFFYRYGRQVDRGVWVIVDASSDSFRKIEDDTAPTCCWKFPSGVIIASLDGKASLVTWIEHIEVNEALNHPLYRNLLSSVHGYGATRWISTLERMCERSLYSARHATASFDHGMQGVLRAPESRKSFLNLTHRMIKDLCASLSLTSTSDLSEPANGMLRMSSRTNYNELSGQPLGEIVTLSTSVRLPLTCQTLFDFLRDVRKRHEWDVMLGQNPMNEMTRLATGAHPGNYASYMQPTVFKKGQLLWIQENSLGPLGALVVFASIDPSVMMGSISRGEDTRTVPILPCGFLISGDESVPNSGAGSSLSDGASTSSGNGNRPLGSLLTLVFQNLVWSNQAEAENYLNTVISNIIRNLRLLLGCPELD